MAFNNFNPYGYYPQTPQTPVNPYQYQQPVQQPMYQQQPQMPQFNQRPVRGRMIDNITEVMPNEVSLDGNVSLFPISDFSCIYAKVWTGDGAIKTFKFVPEKPEIVDAPQEDIPKLLDDLNKRFDKLEAMLGDRSNPQRHINQKKMSKENNNDEQHA